MHQRQMLERKASENKGGRGRRQHCGHEGTRMGASIHGVGWGWLHGLGQGYSSDLAEGVSQLGLQGWNYSG